MSVDGCDRSGVRSDAARPPPDIPVPIKPKPINAPRRPAPAHGFKKGVSGNPGGCPKSVKAIRDLIAERTGNGVEMVDLAVAAMRGQIKGLSREYAHQWLSDRYYGKVKQALDVNVDITVEQLAALEALKLSPHERRVRMDDLRAKTAKSANPVPVLAAPLPDDAEPS